MKFAALAVVVLALLLSPVLAGAQEPVLEEYVIGHGGTLGGPPDVQAHLFDPHLGNGDTRASVRFGIANNSGALRLGVWRVVRPGEIVFALLVFRVEVRGFDSGGAVVFSRDLPGFTFGDSQSGSWFRLLRGLPASVSQVRVKYIGNYE